jgi:ATP-dependent DNA ligase
VIPQYTPMAPTLVRAPFHRPGWVCEEKVDGWRILAYKDGARVRLMTGSSSRSLEAVRAVARTRW